MGKTGELVTPHPLSVPRKSTPYRAVGYVFVVLAVALALRLWGVGFGLPNTRAQPDETRVAGTAARMLTGRLDPGFFNYPTLFMYVEAAADTAYCGAARLAGRFDTFRACAASWPHRWQPFFLAGRLLSAMLGALAIVPAFLLARRLVPPGEGALAGIIAALCVAVAWLHVRDSHFGVTDVAMATMTLVALVLIVRAHERPSAARFALAGLIAGLAVSTKYSAALLAAPVVVSQAAALWQPRWRADSRIAVFAACLAAGFLAASPYALIDRAQLGTDLAFEAQHLAIGHGIALDYGWRHHALVTLPLGIGWPLMLCGIAGGVVALRRDFVMAAIVFSFPAIYYVVAGRGVTVFARYMVPEVPFFCIGTGVLVARVAARASHARRPRLALAGVAALVAACVVPNAWKSVRMDRLLERTDSRVIAAEWMASHVAPGEDVYASGSEWGRPDLWREGNRPPFTLFNDPDRPLERGVRPAWIIVQQSPLTLYNGLVADNDPILREYELRGTVRAYNPAVPHVYDQQDAFFLPLDGFRGIARPGPTFMFYRRRATP